LLPPLSSDLGALHHTVSYFKVIREREIMNDGLWLK